VQNSEEVYKYKNLCAKTSSQQDQYSGGSKQYSKQHQEIEEKAKKNGEQKEKNGELNPAAAPLRSRLKEF
jgi:hypothetical protein